MKNDDSFNDSDEIISLYSFEKVKQTFKTQLQKIVSNSNSLNLNKGKPSETDETSINEQNDSVSTSKSPVEFIEDGTLKRPSDDSIEIISESRGARKTRQSKRLKNKRGGKSETNVSCALTPKKHAKNAGKRGRKKKKQEGVIVEVVTLDDSLDNESLDEEEDLNPEVSVKIIWKSVNVKKFQMRKHQKFSKIFKLLSEEENTPEEKIVLTFNNNKVYRNDTPDSLNLQVYHFLDGGVLSELTNTYEPEFSSVDNGNKISLKFQDVNKRIVKVSMDKKDKMKVGMIKCSEQLEIPLEKIKFYFDGELIEPVETPESLGLDNDDIIDIKIFI